MLEIVMVIDGNEYVYGRYDIRNRNAVNELAMEVRDTRQVETFVREI